ncbi:uncharacterized protein LOC131661328 [Vicia villosa]|uniref:uncharacterized protein LOC131661328 n=1 Tax=Vicia villosa TaxID=3911 RepID=UPI00273BADA2|nr:uncharacterized protein LOC131661328 [Vicia villosa]
MPSVGASGGILTLWNTNSVCAVFNFGGKGYLGMKIIWRGKYYYVVNIYSPISREDKRILWDKLISLKSRYSDGEWLLGGDFNAVRNKRERKGVIISNPRREWSDFEEFIRLTGLEDVPCKGKKYTWFGGDGRTRSRIDRFLVADNIVSDWGVIGQMVEDRDVSDHCPVWLICDKANWGPKPFKVNKEWFSNKDFLPFVKKEWISIKVEGRGDFILKEKLRILKDKLRWWNINVFGRFDLAVEENVRILNEGDVDMGEDDVEDSFEMIERKKRASKDFWLNLKIKENMLIQKSRLKWLNDGDTNSKFFHGVMKARRTRNFIGSLVKEGEIINSVSEIKEEVKIHFEKKFIDDRRIRPVLDGIHFETLEVEDKNFLENPFEESEIKAAIWDCDGLKSPGPDG